MVGRVGTLDSVAAAALSQRRLLKMRWKMFTRRQPFSRGGVGLIGYLLCHLVRTIRHTYYYLRSASLTSSWFSSRTAVCIVHSKIKIRFGVFLITKLLASRRKMQGMPLHNIIYTYQYYNRNMVPGYFYFIFNNNGLDPRHNMYTLYISDN